MTSEPVAFQIATGKTAAAAREASETRFDQQTNRIKTRIRMTNATGEITPKHPAAVATPFPQFLNFI
jgi:hypothetical protein